MSRIFISYRRSDSISEAGRIYDYLYNHFGRDSIFKDVDDIDAGDDFRERVKAAVGQCQILLAVMGGSWLTVKDAMGNRRLDNPADWVRLEIETALKRDIRVIPVLLDGVEMPAAQTLPEVLRPLAYRNAARVRHDPDFRRDMDRVVGVIRRHFDTVSEVSVSEAKVTVPLPPKAPMFSYEVVTVDAKGEVDRRVQHQTEYRREMLGQGVSLDLVAIPGGTFQMGSADGEGYDSERPQHEVRVKPFLMGKYQVTQAQWKVVAALPEAERSLDADPSGFKGDRRPVECVSWDDAVEFCKRLSKHSNKEYRLPSEAEWEYACRAGTKTPFHSGDVLTSKIANCGNSEGTTEAGNFSANAFGLYDMHGNVWEWCLDYWYESYEGAPIDGSAWLGGNDNRGLLRGGSWDSIPDFCRSANRNGVTRGTRSIRIGFRVVCGSSWTLA